MTTPDTAAYQIGDLVVIANPVEANAQFAGKLATITSRPEIIDLNSGEQTAVYAVQIVKSDPTHRYKNGIVYSTEINPAPASDRYDENKLFGDIIVKREDTPVTLYAVEVGDTGEIVIKTKPRD
jgi:hypothetical protein